MMPESMAEMIVAVIAKITVVPMNGTSTSFIPFSFTLCTIVSTTVAAVNAGTPKLPA